MGPNQGEKLLELKDAAVKHFSGESWLELGALTDQLGLVKNHDRLLRSLSWRDPDYSTHAFSVLAHMVEKEPSNLSIIESYICSRFPAGGQNISRASGGKRES
jgi:hypothetical protein